MTDPDSTATLAQQCRERAEHIFPNKTGQLTRQLLRSAAEALERAEQDNAQWQRSFDLYWKRSNEAITAWREAHRGMELTRPDLGKMLEWMLACMSKSGTTIEVLQDMVTEAEAENARLLAALKLLVSDVADYPAWQRPCHALDVARELIADLTEAPR